MLLTDDEDYLTKLGFGSQLRYYVYYGIVWLKSIRLQVLALLAMKKFEDGKKSLIEDEERTVLEAYEQSEKEEN